MTTEPFLRFFVCAFDETIFMDSVPERATENALVSRVATLQNTVNEL